MKNTSKKASPKKVAAPKASPAARPKPKARMGSAVGDDAAFDPFKLAERVGSMSDKERRRFRDRIHKRLVSKAVKAGLSAEEATRRIGDGTFIKWITDHAPQILAAIKALFAIFLMFV